MDDGMIRIMTLTEFLLARIAEDEAWAQAAVKTPGATHWHWVDTTTDATVTPDPLTQEYVTEDGDVSLRSVEELHPVSWGRRRSASRLRDSHGYDPARVLAECEAKRRIVTEAQDPGDDLFVRILATVYADHPDYRPEWRP